MQQLFFSCAQFNPIGAKWLLKLVKCASESYMT